MPRPAVKAEQVAQGQADDPVGHEVADHGGMGISGAPHGAGGDALEAVEELEGGGDQHEGGGGRDHEPGRW